MGVQDSTETIRILLVSSSLGQSGRLKDLLEVYGGIEVQIRRPGPALHSQSLGNPPDLILFDLNPASQGRLNWLQRMRDTFDGPLMVISETRSDKEQILAFEMGADDCVPRKCSPKLIHLKIRALIRRSGCGESCPENEVTLGDLVIDDQTKAVTKNGHRIPLTPAEFEVLLSLVYRLGEPVQRRTLHRTVRKRTWDGRDRTVDVLVGRLRKKLGDDGTQPWMIQSVRGIGYQLITKH